MEKLDIVVISYLRCHYVNNVISMLCPEITCVKSSKHMTSWEQNGVILFVKKNCEMWKLNQVIKKENTWILNYTHVETPLHEKKYVKFVYNIIE